MGEDVKKKSDKIVDGIFWWLNEGGMRYRWRVVDGLNASKKVNLSSIHGN
jgi:hypothetical protein